MKNQHLQLSPEAQKAIDRTTDALRELAYLDDSRLTKINDAIAVEMTALRRQYGNTSTPEGQATMTLRRDISRACAGSFAQLRDDGIDVVALKQARDAETIKGVPPEKLQILRLLHGSDDSRVAHAWRETQRLQGEGKL